MTNEYRQLGRPLVAAEGNLSRSALPVKRTGWQKFKDGISKVWKVVSGPVKSIVGALPFGSSINGIASGVSGLINHFKGSSNAAASKPLRKGENGAG